MKLYRLKEKAKQFVSSYYHERVEPMGFWHNHTAGMCEHLEEVPQRVELELDGTPRNEDCYLVKTGINIPFTEEERQLCERALNGELFTREDLEQCVSHCLCFNETINDWIKERNGKD